MSNTKHTVELNGLLRDTIGKGASRRLRKEGLVPAIIYGDNKDAQSISLNSNELKKALSHESIFSQIIPVVLGNKKESVIIKALHRHPFKKQVLHVDLQRVNKDTEVRVHVHLNIIGEDIAPGIKLSGGVLNKNFADVEVSCTPDLIPEFIDVDVSALNIGESIHLTELKLPKGVTLTALMHGNDKDHDQAVVSINAPRVSSEEETTEEATTEETKD